VIKESLDTGSSGWEFALVSRGVTWLVNNEWGGLGLHTKHYDEDDIFATKTRPEITVAGHQRAFSG